MLSYIGAGPILSVLLRHGFVITKTDFDLARMRCALPTSGREVRAEVVLSNTWPTPEAPPEVSDGLRFVHECNRRANSIQAARQLDPALRVLVEGLAQVDCLIDPTQYVTPGREDSEVVLKRCDYVATPMGAVTPQVLVRISL